MRKALLIAPGLALVATLAAVFLPVQHTVVSQSGPGPLHTRWAASLAEREVRGAVRTELTLRRLDGTTFAGDVTSTLDRAMYEQKAARRCGDSGSDGS